MATENVLTITAANFDSEVLGSSVPVLVDFWAPWCGPCRMIGPIVEEIAASKAGAAKVGKVNVDEEMELASRFGINALPSLLFFKNGEVRDQVVGAVGKAALVSKMDALA